MYIIINIFLKQSSDNGLSLKIIKHSSWVSEKKYDYNNWVAKEKNDCYKWVFSSSSKKKKDDNKYPLKIIFSFSLIYIN